MKRINLHWLKSLAIHAATMMIATFIGLVAIGNKEAPGMILYSLGEDEGQLIDTGTPSEARQN